TPSGEGASAIAYRPAQGRRCHLSFNRGLLAAVRPTSSPEQVAVPVHPRLAEPGSVRTGQGRQADALAGSADLPPHDPPGNRPPWASSGPAEPRGKGSPGSRRTAGCPE